MERLIKKLDNLSEQIRRCNSEVLKQRKQIDKAIQNNVALSKKNDQLRKRNQLANFIKLKNYTNELHTKLSLRKKASGDFLS